MLKALTELLEVVPGCKPVQQGAMCPLCNAPTGYPEEPKIRECAEVCCWALRVIKARRTV